MFASLLLALTRRGHDVGDTESGDQLWNDRVYLVDK